MSVLTNRLDQVNELNEIEKKLAKLLENFYYPHITLSSLSDRTSTNNNNNRKVQDTFCYYDHWTFEGDRLEYCDTCFQGVEELLKFLENDATYTVWSLAKFGEWRKFVTNKLERFFISQPLEWRVAAMFQRINGEERFELFIFKFKSAHQSINFEISEAYSKRKTF
jgi:hypothetical protein